MVVAHSMPVIFSGYYDFLHWSVPHLSQRDVCINVFHFLCQRSVHAHNCNFRREKGFERTASQIGRIVKTFNVQQKKNLAKGKTRPTQGGQRYSSKVSKKGRKCLKIPQKRQQYSQRVTKSDQSYPTSTKSTQLKDTNFHFKVSFLPKTKVPNWLMFY